MTDKADSKEKTEQKEQEKDWYKILAYSCAISVGTLATLLVGASLGGLIGKGVKNIGIKKGIRIL